MGRNSPLPHRRKIGIRLRKGTVLIRQRGLKTRIPKGPEEFVSDMNKLAIEMTQTRRQKNGKKCAKPFLRKMANLEKRFEATAGTTAIY